MSDSGVRMDEKGRWCCGEFWGDSEVCDKEVNSYRWEWE